MKTDVTTVVTFDLDQDEYFGAETVGGLGFGIQVHRVQVSFDPTSDWYDVKAKGPEYTKAGVPRKNSANYHHGRLTEAQTQGWLAKARAAAA